MTYLHWVIVEINKNGFIFEGVACGSMDKFLAFFETMPVWMKLGWVFVVLAFFWILEGNYPLSTLIYNKKHHARTNFILLAIVLLINGIFAALTAYIFHKTGDGNFGLLHMVDLPFWLELLIAIIILDLVAQYFVHYLLHMVPAFWRLHIVHHSDKHVDVTTGTRHHPLDFTLRETFALITVLITGMPIGFYLFYRILSVFFTYWTHANIKMPLWLDKGLGYVFISPNMHKFHHHYKAPWTDSNYGNIFSFWDRMFGTLVYDNVEDIQYGVDIADQTDDENVRVQLGIPFNKNVVSNKRHTS